MYRAFYTAANALDAFNENILSYISNEKFSWSYLFFFLKNGTFTFPWKMNNPFLRKGDFTIANKMIWLRKDIRVENENVQYPA